MSLAKTAKGTNSLAPSPGQPWGGLACQEDTPDPHALPSGSTGCGFAQFELSAVCDRSSKDGRETTVRVVVWGLGYVGTVSAACLLELGMKWSELNLTHQSEQPELGTRF